MQCAGNPFHKAMIKIAWVQKDTFTISMLARLTIRQHGGSLSNETTSLVLQIFNAPLQSCMKTDG